MDPDDLEGAIEDATVGKTYEVSVGDMDTVVHAVVGMLLAKRMRFRNIEYWCFTTPWMKHLVEPDDIVALEEVPTGRKA